MKLLRRLLSTLIAARFISDQPKEAITIDEQPHTHTEQWVPEQEIRHEHTGLGSAITQPRLLVGGTTVSFRQCVSHNTGLISSNGTRTPDFRITIREGFASSFRQRRFRLYAPGIDFSGLSRPSVGTRIRIQFNNVSANVSILLPVKVYLYASSPQQARVTSGIPTGLLRLVADSDGKSTRFIPVRATIAGLKLAPVNRSLDTGYATYEVMRCDPDVIEGATIQAYVAFIANSGFNRPAIGQSTVTVSLAEQTAPEASAERNAFAINACSSSFLFPFVTNQDGADTGIALANTSLDPFGTTTQAGTVSLHFYGNTIGGGSAPAPITTSPIPPGRQLVFTLSRGGNFGVPPTPGFQGYLIAVARFQYCHAIAFISGPGAHSHTYMATEIQRGSEPSEPRDQSS